MQTTESKSTSASGHKNSTPQSKLLVIDRKFNVPVEQLFAAFASAEAVKAWWWPNGLTAERADYDFRPGGHYFINMVGKGQAGGGMTGEFEEIVANKRIVMSDEFADVTGHEITALEAGQKGEWPEAAYITFDFQADDAYASRVRLSQQGIPNEAQKDCIEGWNQMFDKLGNYLAEASKTAN